MSHPTNEDWGLYVYGEAPPELNRKLKSHLNHCAECAAEVATLEKTVGMLEAWKLAPTRRPTPLLQPAMRWAMAALIVLGVGVALGRVTSPRPPSAEQMRAEIKASLLAELRKTSEQLTADCGTLVAAAEARWAEQADTSLRTLGREIIETVNEGRARDQRAIQAVVEQLKQQRDADYVSLRRDLETVAASTDQQLQQARLKLFELAVNTTPRD